MKALLFTLFIGAISVASAASSILIAQAFMTHNESDTSTTIQQPESHIIIGGWYPVFFREYSNSKVQEIIAGITSGKIKRLVISYDENSTLALQIKNNIQAKLNFEVQMEHVPITDTDSTKLNHSQVVVTVFTR